LVGDEALARFAGEAIGERERWAGRGEIFVGVRRAGVGLGEGNA